ncbi:hypothetical protein GT347_26515 [Xylophilus rhododendri]|uniref:Uncharacterized protein n=1 Tax=Xylophilus rhododendri TaxID=2697032 RepID=A0A857JB35_9BURK|nr:hypothetical protein [Xylophilus rhododendri]QHJ01231.1 hypothetical protein GT347_26515 [Xylophilus rhododendri]
MLSLGGEEVEIRTRGQHRQPPIADFSFPSDDHSRSAEAARIPVPPFPADSNWIGLRLDDRGVGRIQYKEYWPLPTEEGMMDQPPQGIRFNNRLPLRNYPEEKLWVMFANNSPDELVAMGELVYGHFNTGFDATRLFKMTLPGRTFQVEHWNRDWDQSPLLTMVVGSLHFNAQVDFNVRILKARHMESSLPPLPPLPPAPPGPYPPDPPPYAPRIVGVQEGGTLAGGERLQVSDGDPDNRSFEVTIHGTGFPTLSILLEQDNTFIFPDLHISEGQAFWVRLRSFGRSGGLPAEHRYHYRPGPHVRAAS